MNLYKYALWVNRDRVLLVEHAVEPTKWLLRLSAWTAAPHCNIQLQTIFCKHKDSFACRVLDCVHVWMSSVRNPFAYESHLFARFCAYQRVTNFWRNVFPGVRTISLRRVYVIHKMIQDSRYLLNYSLSSRCPCCSMIRPQISAEIRHNLTTLQGTLTIYLERFTCPS